MIDPDALQEQLNEKLRTLMGDLERFRKELDNPEHLAELCFLEGDLRAVQNAMAKPPSDEEPSDESA
jgi:hypothetical protein